MTNQTVQSSLNIGQGLCIHPHRFYEQWLSHCLRSKGSVLNLLSFFLVVPAQLFGQTSTVDSPLDGHNFVSLHGGVVPTVASLDDGVIPVPNETFTWNSPSGVGYEVGLSWSRFMPKLFVSTSTTFDLRLSWTRIQEDMSATGEIEGIVNEEDPSLKQQTEAEIDMVTLGLRFAFDTNPMAQVSPTISLGGTFGQILGIDYKTTFDPAYQIPLSEFGLPTTGPTPNRRFFYGALHVGVGARLTPVLLPLPLQLYLKLS